MTETGGSAKEYKIVNAYEDLVSLMVHRHIKLDPAMCKCDKCYLDVCAIVFNNGFARFVTTEPGTLLATLDSISKEKETQLLVATIKAIEIVKKSPQH